VKFIGALGMCLGLNPFLMYGLVGLALRLLAREIRHSDPTPITRALGQGQWLIEASTIAAILVSAIAGGTLAIEHLAQHLVTDCYAARCNLLIPRLAPERASNFLSGDIAQFWRRFESIASSTRASVSWDELPPDHVRFLLVAWVPSGLGITSNAIPAYLNAMVAVVSCRCRLCRRACTRKLERAQLAVLVARHGAVRKAPHAAHREEVAARRPYLFGGFFVVPLNALLQERGHESVGAGNAIAIQNLAENTTMLLMVGLYTLTQRANLSVNTTALGFGACLAAAIGALWVYRARE
jgi:LPLT family lysophospholipid transporter-like MFS transporter